MIALDTNILARFYLNDEPVQASAAARILTEEDVFVAKTVLLELEWVMRGVAGLRAPAIAKTISHLLSLSNVHVEDEKVVRQSLKAYTQGMDFADALHLYSCAGASRFVTFDRRLALKAPKASAVPRISLPG